jgi:N-acetylmuramic acid 6-phosphate etherase
MNQERVLGLEGGGTKTDWVILEMVGSSHRLISQGHLPAANLRLISEERLLQLFRSLPADISRAGIFLAGCVTAKDRSRLGVLARQAWPGAHVVVGSDRESGFAAAFGHEDGIAVISGTGSAVTGRKDGRIENAGGRGHLLGDRGGGYMISLEGLRLALRRYDLEHRSSRLAEEILRALMLNRMEDLIAWTQDADKMAISRLTPVMFAAAQHGDSDMLRIIRAGAASLAEYTASVARWLNFEKPAVRLLGGVFLNQPVYVELFTSALMERIAASSVELCTATGALGAGFLAVSQSTKSFISPAPAAARVDNVSDAATEQVNPQSVSIDQMSAGQLVDLFIEEENCVAGALESGRGNLARAVELLVDVFRGNGRLFYVGAGTSGRLGALDASEIPPTFGEPPERVQAIIAGGAMALYSSVEGAEDDEMQGTLSVIERGVRAGDAVCGITASGRTPFVLAALRQASALGAKTLLLTCNPNRSRIVRCDVDIDLPTGPELITGSTRLKAGTACKVALNVLSTCAMIRLGRVQGNWMTGVNPSNSKLRDRAIRIVSHLKNIPAADAQRLLEFHNWNVKAALSQQ